MEKGVVVFGSVSVLHRARKYMKRENRQTQVVQLPTDLGLKGCSYGLECRLEDLKYVLKCADENGLRVSAVFHVRETENGRVYAKHDLS